MTQPITKHIIKLLHDAPKGDGAGRDLTDELYQNVYQELRRVAGGLMREQNPDHTLRPTDLVHDAYVKIVGGSDVPWQGRAHFLGVASMAMRHILVDHARKKATDKRGGGMKRVTLSLAANVGDGPEFEVIALHEALEKLEQNSARMAKIVELRAFAGLTAKEVAYLLGVSKRTVDDDFRLARMWLRREMSS